MSNTTFADALFALLQAWKALEAEVRKEFPEASDEEVYQKTKIVADAVLSNRVLQPTEKGKT